MKRKEFVGLLLLTLGALLIHGYHPWVEDAEIYVPGIEKILHPELFPFNAQFFESHAHSTLFPNLSLVHNWPQIDDQGTVAPFISLRQWQPISATETV